MLTASTTGRPIANGITTVGTILLSSSALPALPYKTFIISKKFKKIIIQTNEIHIILTFWDKMSL